MDFSKIISAAQKVPDSADVPPVDLFSPARALATGHPALIEDVPAPNAVPGVPQYKLEHRCQRFVIGKELVAIDGQQKIFDDRDDSAALADVMNKCLRGEALLMNRKETFLQDGSVVVWVEWGEMPEKKPTPKGVLTEEKLFSPERVTPRSQRMDAEQPKSVFDTEEEETRTGDAGEEEEDPEPSTNDEEPW